jgi:tyrosinase
MSPVAQVRPRPVQAAVKLRRSATALTDQQLAAYRAAVSAMQGLSDNRGWQYYAGWHGVPNDWCQHGSLLFLPWHRSYLYHFELALQDHDPSVTVPWWDWVTEARIPLPFTQAKVGGSANPLYRAAIKPVGVRPQPGWPRQTSRSRSPGPVGPLDPPLRSRWDWLMEPTDFVEFTRRIEMVHNNIHVWVGGTMGQIPWAAYDPLFFSHHTMVDRVWRMWQTKNPGANPPASIMDTSLVSGTRPIFTVREVLDVQALGYDYAVTTSSTSGTS